MQSVRGMHKMRVVPGGRSKRGICQQPRRGPKIHEKIIMVRIIENGSERWDVATVTKWPETIEPEEDGRRKRRLGVEREEGEEKR